MRRRSIVISTFVCVSVCLSASISLKPHVRSLQIFLCMLPMAVARSSSGRVTKSQTEGAVLGVFPLTMHCNAFAAKRIIRSPITSCSRRDHSVAAAFAANGIGRAGGDGNAQRGRSVIYDCLVFHCNDVYVLYRFGDIVTSSEI